MHQPSDNKYYADIHLETCRTVTPTLTLTEVKIGTLATPTPKDAHDIFGISSVKCKPKTNSKTNSFL